MALLSSHELILVLLALHYLGIIKFLKLILVQSDCIFLRPLGYYAGTL